MGSSFQSKYCISHTAGGSQGQVRPWDQKKCIPDPAPPIYCCSFRSISEGPGITEVDFGVQ